MKNVPVPAQTKLYELVDRATSSNSSVDDFISALTDAASVCEFHLKKLDKKIEKALTFHHRKAMESELEEEGSEGNERHGESPLVRKFHTAVVLLCLKFHKVLLHAPAKALPFLLENLKSDVSEDDFEVCFFGAQSFQMIPGNSSIRSLNIFVGKYRSSQSTIRCLFSFIWRRIMRR